MGERGSAVPAEFGEKRLRKMLREAHRSMERTSARRRDLPVGSSRAKVTTANARWWTCCEEWDRVCGYAREEGLDHLIEEVRDAAA